MPEPYEKKNPIDSAMDYVNSTSDHTQEFSPDDIEANKVIAAVSYIPILFFLPLVVCPNSQFGRFHANQSLALFLLSLVGGILFGILTAITLLIPAIGWIFQVLSWIFSLLMFGLVILGAVNTANGKAKELPVVGKARILHY